MIDKTDDKSVNNLKEIINKFSDLFMPERKEQQKKEEQEMEEMFESIFKSDGGPEPIKMNVGEPS